ncbi:trypsin-like peptidase domain-containing protein [Streptomyces sp. NPDC093546]|uniref:trypsin-like peptidase domain-containing protein n=1 Tax=Streptomyces sp. NPDC093546 TaxID=3366040 RepID=UPI003817FE9D
MTSTPYLPPDRILEVRDAALQAGLADPSVRPLLFENIMPAYRGTLPLVPAPGRQLHSDLNEMNRVERLVDTRVPLEIWLRNAIAQTSEAAPLAVFQRALDDVVRDSSGEPDVLTGLDLPEVKEQQVNRDDTVPFGFLRDGDRAGAAVARVTVPPYEGGAPLQPNGSPHSGTGWLITPDLLVTNHHVVNARTGGSAAAAPDDLLLQARHARARFDYDTDADGEAEDAAVALLVAADPDLDYAVLRLAEAPSRPVLRVARRPLTVVSDNPVAVNIIQHPSGLPKRVALRNNVVYEADERDLRYFTDTRGGSSGSPVLTDDWRVVALHRGTKWVGNASFQGRTETFVNVGTQLAAVLGHLAATSPAVHAEIEAAQQE